MKSLTPGKLSPERLFKQDLEDQVHLAMQKLHALCVTQTLLNSQEQPVSPSVRLHYAMIMEEQATELRRLFDNLLR